MPRPLSIEEFGYDEAAMKEYIAGQLALEKEAETSQLQYDAQKKAIEEHRKTFQAKHKLNTEAIDAARKLKNGRTPKARYAWLRTFDIARQLLVLDDQGDMLSDHVDPGESAAISNAAA